eukprot:4080160-Heterocapsa_arctica.AAC.1
METVECAGSARFAGTSEVLKPIKFSLMPVDSVYGSLVLAERASDSEPVNPVVPCFSERILSKWSLE